VGEEFQKVQRSLRRLSMASDRSGEILQTVSTRLDEMQQRLLQMSRPARAGVSLEEADVLRVLDQLERAASMIDGPVPSLEPLSAARDGLLRAAGWQPVALRGARAEGTAIRIAEVAEGAPPGHEDVRIGRVLEQGYRRADGSLLRPAVVIAAPAGSPTLS
jgi:molecular chaperone GrpE (heat shock protein)